MFIIDGMNGIEAGYHFAGIIKMSPRGWTLSQLWRMAEGAIKNSRREALEIASLVWSIGSIDCEAYLHYGQVAETGSGGPVQVTPEIQSQVDAEIERIRRENPQLPQVRRQSHVES